MNRTPPLILVVDDQNANLQLIGEILDRAGYQLMPALSGEQALSRAALRPPDLVLLDMAMPGMGGVETCKRLHEQHGRENLPVIFVTAVNDRHAMTTAFEAGAVDYITKPFIVEELLARVRTHLDLKLARDRLAEMVRDREDVIDVVAHDLKNPLTCIMFASRSLHRAATAADPARIKDLVAEIDICTEEALDYIQRFLARGAMKQRLRQFGAGAVDLREVAAEAVKFQRMASEERQQRVTVEGQARAWADARALRNVIQNLISNASRYSKAGAEIQIELGPSQRSGYSLCAVRDSGIGIGEEAEARLFQRHIRSEAASVAEGADSRYSSGLGLAIAKHDVVQMGGNLWYQANEGGGSVFIIELPQTASSEGEGI